RANGELGQPTRVQKNAGTLGPNKERQEGPHAHFVGVSSDNRFLFVADLGLDRVLVYRFDAVKGDLDPIVPPQSTPPDARAQVPVSVPLAPGTGPRHVAFSSDGRFLYVLGEITSAVTVFSKDKKMSYQALQTISTLPDGFSGRKEAAEIAVHPSGKW